MPKGKIEVNRKRFNATRKNKLGGRKSTKSATQTSTEELRKIANGNGRGKDRVRARRELERRGAPLVVEEAA